MTANPYSNLLWEMAVMASYRLSPRGGQSTRALISSSLAHPQQALEKVLGSQVYGFKVLPGAVARLEEPTAAVAIGVAHPSRFASYSKSVPAPLSVEIANDPMSLGSGPEHLFMLRDCVVFNGIPLATPTSDKISNASMPWGSRSDHLAMMHALLKGRASNFNAKEFRKALLA